MYKPQVVDWNSYRLSQIEEETSICSGMENDFQKFGIAELSAASVAQQSPDGATSPIYCSTDKIVTHDTSPTTDDSEEQVKDAVRKISDKYDSLERMQSHINRNTFSEDIDGVQLSPEDSGTVRVVDVVDAVQRPEQLTDADITQIEMFYRSHKSNVIVCQALTNLYFGRANSDGSGDNWDLHRTGIPVLLMDTGDGRRQRKLFLLLAEKGTGFTLWRDQMDHLSHYRSVQPNFHTVFLSSDHTRLAGFSFDDAVAANDFLNALQALTSDPTDVMLLTGRKTKKDKNGKKSKTKFKAPKKMDISQPCCFVHVTKLEGTDKDHYKVPPPPKNPRPPSLIQQFNSSEGVIPIRTSDQE